MAHELLLVSGPDHLFERRRRSALARHAALTVPGAATHHLVETPYAAVALIECAPSGGDFAELQTAREGAKLHIATTSAGLAVARQGAGAGAESGSEAGHVRVAVSADGSIDVTTDGMAFLPFFWAEHAGNLYLSTHLASLVSLGLPADEDILGVLQYLVMFHPLQQRTLLRLAQQLPPGGHLRWRPGGHARLTSLPLFVPSESALSDDEALATYRDVWPIVVREAFERNAGSRTVLGLSGGLDSRAIAASAVDVGIRPLAYTYGDDRNRETLVARQVARRLRLAHVTIPVTDDRLLVRAEAIAARLDGAHGPAEMYESWFADRLRSFADVIVNGLAGGPLWGDDKAVGLNEPDAVLSRTVERYTSDAIAVAPFLLAHDANDLADGLRSWLAESMSDWDFSARADTAVYWKLANRQLRWGNMLVNALRRDGLRIEAPFLDARFLHFAARLNAQQRLNGRLYLRVHREVLASTANIGRSDDGNSPRHLNHVYWSGEQSYLTQLASLTREHPIAGARRVLRRAAQLGAEALLRYSGPSAAANRFVMLSSVFPADMWVRNRNSYADRLTDLLERTVGAHPLLSDEHVTAAIAAVRAGHPTASATTLAKVATLGLWLVDYSSRAADAQQLQADLASR